MSHNARLHCGPIQAKVRKEKYSRQRATTDKNRVSKRLKHMKRQPNDLQTAAKLP